MATANYEDDYYRVTIESVGPGSPTHEPRYRVGYESDNLEQALVQTLVAAQWPRPLQLLAEVIEHLHEWHGVSPFGEELIDSVEAAFIEAAKDVVAVWVDHDVKRDAEMAAKKNHG